LLLHNQCNKGNVPNPADERAEDHVELEYKDLDEVHQAQDQGKAARGLGRQVCRVLIENFV